MTCIPMSYAAGRPRRRPVCDTDASTDRLWSDGVALAAIQGLNAKVEEQQREIAELRRAVEVLMARTSPEGRVAHAR